MIDQIVQRCAVELNDMLHDICAWHYRAVASLAESPEFHLSKKLQPGDIEIVHNPTIFHSRGEVFDGGVCLPFAFAAFWQKHLPLCSSHVQSDLTCTGLRFDVAEGLHAVYAT